MATLHYALLFLLERAGYEDGRNLVQATPDQEKWTSEEAEAYWRGYQRGLREH